VSRETKSGLLVSDFNVQNLSAYLNKDDRAPRVAALAAPFGQVGQVLLDDGLPCWQSKPEFVVVWTRPESVLEGFRHLLAFAKVDTREILRQVDEYAAALLVAKDRTRTLFVPTWTVPAAHCGHGVLDLMPGIGVSRVLMQCNLRLLENLDGAMNVIPLQAATWIEAAGERCVNPRLWYMAKIPFGNEVFRAAARDIKAALQGVEGKSRKLIILDLDDTLWGGIVGELGWEGITLGGHDPEGEALVDFQRGLQALARSGVILAVVSKNEEAVALEAMAKHPEMVLRPEDFAAWRINWGDKAQNIIDLTKELNLGMNSAVFIDDSAVERSRIREALPEVVVPEWPSDKRLYPRALASLDCFDRLAITDEDRQRPEMYTSERRRSELRCQAGSLDEWLHTLEMKAEVEPLSKGNLARSTQLLNKTNQMNLSTRRLTERELMSWASEEGHQLWTLRVSDKFGNYGLTGLVSVERDGSRSRIVDFVLSCRVMGRGIEETMLHLVVEWARSKGLSEVLAGYRSTPKNKPCYDFLARSGMQTMNDRDFAWNAAREYMAQSHIRLVRVDRETNLPG